MDQTRDPQNNTDGKLIKNNKIYGKKIVLI